MTKICRSPRKDGEVTEMIINTKKLAEDASNIIRKICFIVLYQKCNNFTKKGNVDDLFSHVDLTL